MSHINNTITLLVHIVLPTRNIITNFCGFKFAEKKSKMLQKFGSKFSVKLTAQMSNGFKKLPFC